MSIVVCNEECEGDLLAKNPVFLSSLTTQNGTDIAQKCCEGPSNKTQYFRLGLYDSYCDALTAL